jgi:surface antigen
MKIIPILVVLMFSLTACLSGGANQGAGTVLGGVAGAILGSKVGKGSGRIVAIASGTLLGAALGSKIGQALDENDRRKMAAATQQSLEQNQIGQSTSWQNPDSGHSGTVQPTRTYADVRSNPCRDYQHTVMIAGKTEILTGSACRQADGTWRAKN